MRLTLLILKALLVLSSCNNNDITKATSVTMTVHQQNDTTSYKSQRKLLIEELKRLRAVFASKDKEKIADLFQFPISDTIVGIYTADSTFNAQLDKNGGKTTRAMFIRYFSEISESLQFDQLDQLFKRINIAGLLRKDTLKYETIITAEPCYHFYIVGVEKDHVTLTLGTNSNKHYKSKSVSEDEIPENDSSICESVLWWVFRFDGKKLHFKKISGAG